MTLSELKGKRILIFGFGREGRAAFEALKKQLPEAHMDVVDDRGADGTTMSIEEALVVASEEMVVVRSPGVPLDNKNLVQLKNAGATVTTGMNIFFAQRKGRGTLIGVTGSKGKSTTCAMLAHVLKEAGQPVQLVGNIGEPAIKHLDDPDDTVFVVELSSYQLEDLEVGPDIGVILNLFEGHQDHHRSTGEYWQAKLRLGALAKTLVYNEAFEPLKQVASKHTHAIALPEVQDELSEHLQITGEHFAQNARAVVAVARELGIPDAQTFTALESFYGLPHRLENVGTYKGITFIDDSISTIPESAIAAMNAFQDRLGAIILGGKDEGGDMELLAGHLKTLADVIVYVLPGGTRIKEALGKYGIDYQSVETIEKAVQDVYTRLEEGDVCLLSPSATSYDQFKNFEERGEKFAAWAKKYGES